MPWARLWVQVPGQVQVQAQVQAHEQAQVQARVQVRMLCSNFLACMDFGPTAFAAQMKQPAAPLLLTRGLSTL